VEGKMKKKAKMILVDKLMKHIKGSGIRRYLVERYFEDESQFDLLEFPSRIAASYVYANIIQIQAWEKCKTKKGRINYVWRRTNRITSKRLDIETIADSNFDWASVEDI
jgi:hypothetical protein